jgi:sugar phosphate isomerase/epimerase
MSAMSRREFFGQIASDAVAAGLVSAGFGAELHANPLGIPIGSQTYPHRALLKENFPALLKQLADIGIQRIELCSPFGYAEFGGLSNGAGIRKVIADHGLTCESAHFSLKELRQDQAASIAWANDVGITQMFVATLGGSHPTMDDVKRAAEEYNRIAAVAARAGMQQGLHNEGFEVSTVDGKRTYDILMELLDPRLVKFQFQMSTIRNGFDAAEYFTKYPGRFVSMHLQDWNPETKTIVAVGKGSIDWKKVFTAAKAGGVKSYFIEQDMDMTRDGATFLKKLEV